MSEKSKKSKVSNNSSSTKQQNIIYIIPIMFVIAVLPLIVKMHEYKSGLTGFDWFSINDKYFDFFLYYKQRFIIYTSLIMAVVLLVYKFIKKEKLRFNIVLIPLGIYALLSLLSSVLSEYRSFSFHGSYEQFESIWILLAYCVFLYYAYNFIRSERELRYISYVLLASILYLTFICLTQLFGHDFYSSQLGWNIISNATYRNYKDNFSFASQEGYSYLTFYNANYIGMYINLTLPIMLSMALYVKKLWLRSLFILGSLGLLICLYGSLSSSGILGLLASLLLATILLWRNILKYWKIVLPIVTVFFVAIFIFNMKTHYIDFQINKITNFTKSTAPMLSEIQTNDDNVAIKYNGNVLKTVFAYDESTGISTFQFQDENNLMVLFDQSVLNGPATISDDRFPGFVFEPRMFDDNTIGFFVTIDGHQWYFTNQIKDHTYYYVNNVGKYIKILMAPSSVFTGYESFASGRGYIWSKTIPLLKDRILLGTGADTYVFAFPQTDYVNLYNNGFSGLLVTKPHSMFLQIAVQTGVLSLIAFLVLYGMYFISGIRLYMKGVINNIYWVVGASILIGTTGYMICAIANDSSVTVAPIYWVLLGIGLAVNQKVKQQLQSNSMK